MGTAPKRIVTPEQRRRENRLIATTLAFVAIGPPIGLLTAFLLGFASELLSGKSLAAGELIAALGLGLFAALGGTLLYGFWSYLFGAIPAGIAGVLVGYLLIFDRFSWWFVLLIGFAVGCLWFAQYFLFPLGGDPRTKLDLKLAWLAATHIITCLVPTILCTALVRHYERKWCRNPETTAETAHDN